MAVPDEAVVSLSLRDGDRLCWDDVSTLGVRVARCEMGQAGITSAAGPETGK